MLKLGTRSFLAPVLAALAVCAAVSPSEAAWLFYHRPAYEGRILEGESGGPIEGAVVVAVYYKETFGIPGPYTGVIHVKETVTGKDGRFRIPSYTTLINPFAWSVQVTVATAIQQLPLVPVYARLAFDPHHPRAFLLATGPGQPGVRPSITRLDIIDTSTFAVIGGADLGTDIGLREVVVVPRPPAPMSPTVNVSGSRVTLRWTPGAAPGLANGYLVEQFLNANVNTRTDAWGGGAAARNRFAVEVARAVTAAVGAERVGIRISPLGAFNATGAFDGVEAQFGLGRAPCAVRSPADAITMERVRTSTEWRVACRPPLQARRAPASSRHPCRGGTSSGWPPCGRPWQPSDSRRSARSGCRGRPSCRCRRASSA